jgi:alpha-tubulin suppressor-like RCC1 family protein
MDSIVSVSAGNRHTMAIKTDGSLWTWGLTKSRYSVNGVIDEKLRAWAWNHRIFRSPELLNAPRPVIIEDSVFSESIAFVTGSYTTRVVSLKILDSVESVSVGNSTDTMVIKTDGSLLALKEGAFYYLHQSDTDVIHARSHTKVMDSVASVSDGYNHTAAVKADGSLWAWGRNDACQLGDGTARDRNTPVKIMDSVVSVSAGYRLTAVIKTDGSVWTWGNGKDNGLNKETRFYQSTPVRIE